MSARSRPSVLLVDDNEEVRDVLRLMFELDGFDIVGEAENGLEGVALGIQHHPDFIVLDSQMPVVDGARAAAQLRASVPEVRIVVFSGTLRKAPDWADHFLTKDRLTDLSPLLWDLLSAS
jgi:CheY-like chemotaxis protein